jgi:hypothetical protein
VTSGDQQKPAASGIGRRVGRLADGLVFMAAFALYAASASPALGWLDSPELVAASVALGIPHSPGHPLPVFLASAAALVPIGDLALRANLAAAAAGAATCAIVCAAARALAGRAAPALVPWARAGLGAAAALVFAGSWAAWSQAVRAEVYALTAALLVAALAAVLAWDGERRPRWLVAAGLAGGLALSAHHLIAALLLAPAGLVVLVRRRADRPGPALAGATALAGILGLAAFLYLPARSAAPRAPELDWGAPHVAERFAWTVSGAMFADNASAEHASSRTVDAAQSIAAVVEAASPALAALAALGALLLVRRRGGSRTDAGGAALAGFRVAALLVGVAGAGIAGRALFGFDPETSDHHGYLLPAAAAVVLLAVAGAAMALERSRRVAAAAGVQGGLVIAGLLFAVVRAAAGWPDASLARAHASDDLARLELEALPPRALLLVSYFQTSDRAIALRAVEGTRPDVTVLHRGILTLPGARESAERRHPELSALLRAPLAAGRPTPIAELSHIASHRPVFVELDPDLDPSAHEHLVSSGRFARFVSTVDARERDRAEAAEIHAQSALAAVADRAERAERADARAALLWLDFSRLEHYCTMGRTAAAQEALRRAWDLFPGDVMLEERAARCHLRAPDDR